MSVLGQFVGGILKQKPKVPAFVKTDAAAEQTKAIGANQAALPVASKLAREASEENQATLLANLRAAIPDYDVFMQQGGKNISSMLRGELPEDVAAAVERRGAAKALGGGYAGSDASRKLVSRDLGLTSLQLTQQGLDSAMKWMANAKQVSVAPIMDVTSMFINPAQQIAVTQYNNEGQFQRDYRANQLKAQYDWRTVLGTSIGTTDAQLTQAVLDMGVAAAGSMGSMGGMAAMAG